MPLFSRFWSTDRSLTALLALLIVLVFVIDPLAELGVSGQLAVEVIFSLLLLSGVGAAAKGSLPRIGVGGLVIVSVTLRWVRLTSGANWLAAPDAFFSALLCIILAVIVLVQVFREGPITPRRIQGAIAVYLLMGLAWAFTYELIALRRPDAFTAVSGAPRPDMALSDRFVYFSFVTLTTVGYGDITPVHPIARSFATAEALVGQLFPAILLARLVSMELYHRQEKRAAGG